MRHLDFFIKTVIFMDIYYIKISNSDMKCFMREIKIVKVITKRSLNYNYENDGAALGFSSY